MGLKGAVYARIIHYRDSLAAECIEEWFHLCSESLRSLLFLSGYLFASIQTTFFLNSYKAYDTSKQLIYASTPNRKSSSLSVGELAAAGFLSAVPTTLVTAPVERAKVLLQVRRTLLPWFALTLSRFKVKVAQGPSILGCLMLCGICTRRVESVAFSEAQLQL